MHRSVVVRRVVRVALVGVVGVVVGVAGRAGPVDAAEPPTPGSLLRTFLAATATAVAVDGGYMVTVADPRAGIAFTDRPARRAFRFDPVRAVSRWAQRYGDDPPNVALAGVTADGVAVARVATVASAEVVDPRRLRFSLRLLDDPPGRSIPADLADVTVFVDEPGTAAVGDPERATGRWLVTLNAPDATARRGSDRARRTFDLSLARPGVGVGFTEQPERRWVRIDPARVPAAWPTVFGDDPPNAVLSGVAPGGREVAVPVTVLGARAEGDGLGFTVRAIGRGARDAVPPVLRDAVLSVDEALSVTDMDSPCSV
ncbi:MAG: hypothetical protein ACKOA9_14205 [Actinomycetota bacterium]